MRKVQIIFAVVIFLFSFAAMAAPKQKSQATHSIEPLPKDLETQLALSSLPPHLRENATVYVLNPDRGFEVARRGTNGFHALVDRTDPFAFSGDWPYTAYRDDILVPISFDEAGAKTHMKVLIDGAQMRANGMPPDKLKKLFNERFKAGYYLAPERPGISYMLSPVLRTYPSPDQNDKVSTFNYPHYMFYAPNVSNEDVGGRFLSSHIFVISQGPLGYMVKGVGLTEKAVINKEYEGMITRLCEFKKVFCLPTPQ